MGRPQTIQIYLPSGDPAGLRIASLTTRTVRVFDVPRSLLPEFLGRPEAQQVGVYYLFSSGEEETPRCYIGQSGNVGSRLKRHGNEKEFWTKAMVAVSLTNEWTVTHAAYLEWASIARANTIGRYEMVNGNQATNPFTPEPLEADCQEFIETIAVLLATLGAPVLEPAMHPSRPGGPGAEEELLYFRERGCDATGYQTPEGLLVLTGSTGRNALLPSATTGVRKQREALHADGVIDVEATGFTFRKDHLFSSPSAAGCFLVGGSNNGRESWKNRSGQSINVLEQLAIRSSTANEASD